jgi:hypothetical protein
LRPQSQCAAPARRTVLSCGGVALTAGAAVQRAPEDAEKRLRAAVLQTRAVCHSALESSGSIGNLHTNENGRGVMPARPSYRCSTTARRCCSRSRRRTLPARWRSR